MKKKKFAALAVLLAVLSLLAVVFPNTVQAAPWATTQAYSPAIKLLKSQNGAVVTSQNNGAFSPLAYYGSSSSYGMNYAPQRSIYSYPLTAGSTAAYGYPLVNSSYRGGTFYPYTGYAQPSGSGAFSRPQPTGSGYAANVQSYGSLYRPATGLYPSYSGSIPLLTMSGQVLGGYPLMTKSSGWTSYGTLGTLNTGSGYLFPGGYAFGTSASPAFSFSLSGSSSCDTGG